MRINCNILKKITYKRKTIVLEYSEDHDGAFYFDKATGDVVIELID